MIKTALVVFASGGKREPIQIIYLPVTPKKGEYVFLQDGRVVMTEQVFIRDMSPKAIGTVDPYGDEYVFITATLLPAEAGPWSK